MADKYNVEAAEILAKEALRLPIAEAVPIYEQLLATFPTAAKYWKQYVEALMSVNHDDAVKQVFSRCLMNCLNVPLWRCYIQYIRKVNEKRGIEGQEETRKAFDFLLNCIGADIASGPLWMEYITFLKSLPAPTSIEETQRMTAVRKAYQKAIVTPTFNIEQIWREYEFFENSVGRALAKGLLSEYQAKYNSARAVLRERKKYIDEIDWNMLAVPPSGFPQEETQWMAWKRFLAFEKGNPQRIDSAFANRQVAFTYEQCLMYLYHYPDIWYDYATWQAKSGSIDAAIKIFNRALKALPDSEMLKYAYAELEESRGSVQAAKKVYESLLAVDANATALSHIQFIRFLRRTEGVDAARKYFMDSLKSPSCTYHVYVAYATMAFCLDKDAKLAHRVFEAGMKRFMHEPSYILEYADFLARLNDDRNIRALFERALSLLPPDESDEIWKRFTQFEQTYGDLASMLKVEQRRKEALSRTGSEEESALGSSLQDVVSRYSFMDLWPCSSKDLDHLARQEWLSKNIDKKIERPALAEGVGPSDRNFPGVPDSSNAAKVVYPDTSRMVIYDPRQKIDLQAPAQLGISSNLPSGVSLGVAAAANGHHHAINSLPPALATFVANLPSVAGPSPNVDFVISICLQSNLPLATGKSISQQAQAGPAPTTSEVSSSAKFKPRDRHAEKRKYQERHDDEEAAKADQGQSLPRDVFKLRQLQKSRAASSHTGSASYGSAFSGELSGSTS